jgi:hypothetical protein
MMGGITMNKRNQTWAWLVAAVPLCVGCGGGANLVGNWEALENGSRLVEFRFGGDNRVTIVEFMPGRRVLPTAGLTVIDKNNPTPTVTQPYEAVSQFQFAVDANTNPARLRLSGIGTDAGIEMVYLVRFITSQEVELKLLAGPPGQAGAARIGPEILILHRRS